MVRSGYKILNQDDQSQRRGILELIWSIKASPSTLVCIWRVMLDRLPTKSNLTRRGVVMGSSVSFVYGRWGNNKTLIYHI